MPPLRPALGTRPGPHEIALRDAWPSVRRRLWKSPRYWPRSLRLLRHYNLRELRIKDVYVRMPKGVTPDCEGCQEVCCTGRHRVVSLRLVDIAAFMDAGLQHAISVEKPRFSTKELSASSALYEQVHSDLWKWFPVLRQDETQTCVLLGEDLRCTAHPFWPLSCARFPYSLNLMHRTIFFAQSCRYHQTVPAEEANAAMRPLIQATLDAYNQKIRDLVMVHLAPEVLRDLGLLPYLSLPKWILRGV